MSRRMTLVCLLLLTSAACLQSGQASHSRARAGGLRHNAQPAPDWARARDEAVQFLSDLIKIDTSNPPGNETEACAYLKSVLEREGIASQLIELEPGRGNLVARLRGNGRKRPILLMAHTDVVGVEREKWTVDPFGGVVKDGSVWGRGALDTKGLLAINLEIFLLLHRLKVPLDRDVIFLAEAGEEATPQVGINFLVEKHWDKIACEFALNEGGSIRERHGRVEFIGVATTEKVSNRIRLVARGTSGHGSVPRLDNPVTHIAAAVAKIGSYQMPMRLNETTRAFFERLAKISPPEEARLFMNLADPAVQEKLRASYIEYNSMLRTSLVPTVIKGGFRVNVIPGDAEASIDIRAVPGEDTPAMVARLRDLINDPLVEIIPPTAGRPAAPPSSIHSEMFLALERAQARVFPGAVTLPTMLTGGTDSAQLRAKGVHAYGVGDLDLERIHGNDERMSIKNIGSFVELIYRAVADVAASRQP
jgi:acetylornithine deacetylase/succinyl-diaminopimelate desuccinylase-like protein